MRECFPLIESTLSVWRRLSGLLLIPVLLMGAVTQVKAQTLREAYDLAKPPGTVVADPSESGPADILAYGRAAGDRLGRVVRSADLNGDGVEDLIVASHDADEGQPVRASAGAVYVWFGDGDIGGIKDVAGTAGTGADVKIIGGTANDQMTTGGALTVADVNGDGVDDLVIGAANADGPAEGRSGAGEVYVVFGRSAPATFPSQLDMAVQGSGGADVIIYGAGQDDQLTSGGALAAGDVTSDGVPDILLGTPFANGPGGSRPYAGAAYVVAGRQSPSPFPQVLDLAESGPTGADVTVHGASANDNLTLGGAISAGDVNGDGLLDFILGALTGRGPNEARPAAGEAYVIFGRTTLPAVLDLSLQGSTGADVTIYGATANDQLGSGGALLVADVTGDGISDLVLGAVGGDGPDESRDGSGEAYIVVGRHAPQFFPATVDLALQGNAGANVTIYGATAVDNLTSGGAFAVGDVNADGIADLLLGAYRADGSTEERNAAGEAYIVLGRASLPLRVDLDPTTSEAHADVTIFGATAGDNLSIGGTVVVGDVNGDGFADLLLGARDADGPADGRSNSGEVYMVAGRTTFESATIDLASQAGDGADMVVYGASAGDQLSSGGALSVGDVNGDGVLDLLLGAFTADAPAEARDAAGEAYVILGAGNPPDGPEIGISQPVEASLPDGGGRFFGTIVEGYSSSRTFTIRNNGNDTLQIAEISKDGTHASDFTVDVSAMETQIGPGESTTFEVNFAPGALGTRTATLHVQNNDANENPFDIVVTGAGVAAVPEISVEQPPGTAFFSGSVRNYGEVLQGASTARTFTIRNTGTATLTLNTPVLSGANAGDFSFETLGATSLLPGETTALVVTFSPSNAGVREATLELSNNDLEEGLFVIKLAGTGLAPNLVVEYPSGTALLDGQELPLGSAALGATFSRTFTLRNAGTAELTGLTLGMGGEQMARFGVLPLSQSTLGVGASLTFTVTFDPQFIGTHEATLEIGSNDPDTPMFELALEAEGVDPEIVVEQPADVAIVDGGSRSFGTVSVGAQASLTFTVRNTGTTAMGELALQKTGTHAGDLVLTPLGVSSLAAGASLTFTVSFAPQAPGVRSATLQILNNDADESPFDIHFSADATAPEITVEMAGEALADGVSVVEFDGAVIEEGMVQRLLTIRNDGTEIMTGLGLSLSGAAAGEYAHSTLAVGTLNAGASTTVTVTFSPTSVGSRGAVLHILSNDLDEGSFDVGLTGVGLTKAPVYSQQPVHTLGIMGQEVTLQALVNGADPKEYQWRKGNAVVRNATGSSLVFAAVKTSDAGIYKQLVSNSHGSAESEPVYLGVMKPALPELNVKEGGTLALSCTVTAPAGIKPTFQWFRGSDPLSDGGKISGAQTKALKVSAITPEEAGEYSCEVTMTVPGGSATRSHGVTTVLVVQKPSVPDFPLPTVRVGESVEVQIPALENPTSFSVSGLPPGIVLNKATGLMSGRPKAAKTKVIGGVLTTIPYTLKITVKNVAGSSAPVLVDWLIEPLSPQVIGTFNGLVERHSILNDGLGGSFKLVTTASGSFSGALKLAKLSYAMKGSFETPTGGGDPQAQVVVARKAPLTPLSIGLTIDEETGELTATVDGGTMGVAAVEAWRNPWSSSNKLTPTTLSFTAGLVPAELVWDDADAPANFPQGDGYALLKVSSTGIASWSGKLADGTALTGSTTVGGTGAENAVRRVALHGLFYTNTGSAQGWSVIDHENNLWDATVTWFKAEQEEKNKTRSYKGGIALHDLTLVGGVYNKPQVGEMVLGLDTPAASDTSPNAKVTFAGGGLDQDFEQEITINAKNSASVAANERQVKLRLTATTGLISGSFALADLDPLAPAETAKLLKRTAPFFGVLVPRLGQGLGHFQLPRLPESAGETVTKTPIYSGQMTVSKIVEP